MEHLTALSIVRSLRGAVEKSRHLCPDAVVLDVRPDGRGLDSLSSIKKDFPNTRVYMLTHQGELRDQALRAGADGFFDKTFELDALVAQLLGTAAHAGPGDAR